MIKDSKVDRQIVEDVLRRSLKDRIKLTKKQTKEVFKEYKLSAIKHNNNKIVGCFLEKGNEVHIAIMPSFKGKWFSKKLFKQLIGDLIQQYGFIKTTMMPDNTDGLNFIYKLGFRQEGDWYVYAPNKFLS